MPIHLPPHVLDHYELKAEDDLRSLEQSLCSDSSSPFGLLPPECREELISVAKDGYHGKMEMHMRSYCSSTPAYCEFTVGCNLICRSLVLARPTVLCDIPTDAGRLLIRAWASTDGKALENILGEEGECRLALLEWLTHASHIPFDCIVHSFLHIESKASTLGGLPAPPKGLIHLPDREVGRMLISKPCQQLLRQALAEISPKWRYLGFYRILEFGYLQVILEDIQNGFLETPQPILEEALVSVGSELRQLHRLATKVAIVDCFQEISLIVKNLKVSNRYANAIDRCTKKKADLLGREESDKGVVLAYQIRCSIVHAGTSGPVIEKFEDADVLLYKVVPLLEDAAIRYLRISRE